MRDRDLALFAVFSLAIGVILGASLWDSVRETPTTEAIGKQQEAKRDLEASQKAPPQTGRREGSHPFPGGDDGKDKSLERWTAIFTGAMAIIAFAQIWLFVWQLGLMRDALSPAKESAVAAELGARATLNSVETMKRAERAYVTLSHKKFHLLPLETTRLRRVIEIEIKNYGRTPATVTDVRLKADVVAAQQSLPDEPDYSNSDIVETAKTFLVPQADLHVSEPLGWITKAEMEEVRSGAKRLFIYGYVEYIDKFGATHHGRYGRMFSPIREAMDNSLVFIKQSRYNDDVQIDPPV